MLSPKRTKHRKMQKGHNRGLASVGSDISFGDFGYPAPHHYYGSIKDTEGGYDFTIIYFQWCVHIIKAPY